ncbi:aldehyde dehydrogenase [Lineolata rhizophorae]|uniref:aldehyde dehydrogenase (NAD(+)) n=1 Tax=Lineolata rhizophorae TaxID=578093 RepID=A0A6A6PB82_9PEZI|nr:aldehyde dehydrogenase [Lineolata rhizophorae]
MSHSNGTSSSFDFSASKLPLKLFINNEYVNSSGTKKLSVHNPRDGSLVSDSVPVASEQDVDSAVAAAEAAFPAWRKTPPDSRREILLKFASLVEAHDRTLAELTRITLGSPYRTMGSFDTKLCCDSFKYYAGWIDKLEGETHPQDAGFLQIVRNEPLGVVAGLVTWNGPLCTTGFKAAPALAAGNCFILKPSEKTPFAALALGPLIKEAGFPPGVFQVVSGDGSTGALLASHMRIRGLSFTGSIPVGKKIQEMAAKTNLKRVVLELGGKSPAIVFDDCDLENTVAWTVRAITVNTGQVCFAASKVYVQEGIYDKFLAKYKAGIESKVQEMGDPEQESTCIGPLVDKAQSERVKGFIQRGVDERQGTLLTGGKQTEDDGLFVKPTVFTDVDQTAEIYNQEIFGPVAIVNTFKTEEEVIQKANSNEYGLMAGVFTQDINRALRVAGEVDSGMVGINCVSMALLTSPFGGSKASGIGRELGKAGMLAFTEPKTIMVNMTY